jgi:hypothetical protein
VESEVWTVERSVRQRPEVVTLIRCGGRCGFGGRLAAHHDRLLQAGTDASALLDLIELAVTWNELDYSSADVVPPTLWLEFCAQHAWPDPGHAMRAFELATDVALHARSDWLDSAAGEQRSRA